MSTAPQTRAAAVAVSLAFVLVLLLCLPFLFTGTDVPSAVVVLGRVLPGVASLVAIRTVLGRGHLAGLWRLQPWSLREVGVSYLFGIALMLPVLVGPALVGQLFGAALQPASALLAAVPVILVGTAVFALSTFGEEVLWRGHLQSASGRLGFWPASVLIGVLWMLWHLPLHGVYLVQGTLSTAEVVAATVGIAFWAPLLAALVERRGVIWPAVFAHAVPLSSLQLLEPGSLDAGAFWALTAIGWAAMLAATMLVRRVGPRPQVAVA